MHTQRLEASVVHNICTQLENLGWIVDERRPDNNVTQQRVITSNQQNSIRKANKGKLKYPDFVLYEQASKRPIGIIEAKRPGESLKLALEQAKNLYAKPLECPLIFAYNDTYVETEYLYNNRSLKIDGEDVRQFIDHYNALRFVNEGSEILSAPKDIQISREKLISIFKKQAKLLREAGLQGGLDRFGAFSDILFLKLMDERSILYEQIGRKPLLDNHLRWNHIINIKKDRLSYVKKVVWPEMNKEYDSIFDSDFPINSDEIFKDIMDNLSELNFTSADTDIKGDAFEYFLKNAYQAIKIKDLGEYFTPRNIVRTMVSMVAPKLGETVYDPFCGTGGFLIEAFKYISLRIKKNKETEKILEKKTIYGSEITATARVAKMNMILFGDGNSNIERRDSFANPEFKKYDIILTNPPYSQNTRYGNLYKIPSNNGDAIAMQHCFESLKPYGRAAILVKEDFLTTGGGIGKVRNLLLNSAKNFTIVSLPRRLFEPYTPTKTSIIYFEKDGQRNKTYFFVIKNVGHTFGSKKKIIKENDLPKMLDGYQSENFKDIMIDHYIGNHKYVRKLNSLWIYDYKEIIPTTSMNLDYLGNHIIRSGKRLNPSNTPDKVFTILGVNNIDGVFINEEREGNQIKQKYIQVSYGDIVYNPNRVNVGSIGVVSKEHEGGLVSGIYIVFRPKNSKELPSYYLHTLLKSKPYLDIIREYDTKYGAVRANLNYEQLSRIKIIMPNNSILKDYKKLHAQIMKIDKMKKTIDIEKKEYINRLVDKPVADKELFDSLISKASQPDQ
jgi:type I restriction enzyme M protein